MTIQKISIPLQNMTRCFEFFIDHLGFQHNQTYKLSHLYNENEH